jgi:ParB-like chromosome segregation protein Spo0J
MSGLPDFELPDLRFVEVERLVPHEQHDEQRSQPLVAVMRSDGVLRNPPVVAPLDDGRFVVLDGANRSTAARLAGLPHLVVQVVDYYNPDLRLSIWNHALLAFPSDSIEELLEELPDLVSSRSMPAATSSSETACSTTSWIRTGTAPATTA